MDDKETPENSEKNLNKLDLNQLENFSFGTQWTQDKSSPADKSSHGKRPRGDDRGDPRRDRRGFRKPAGGGDRRGADRRPRRDGDREGRYSQRGAPQYQGPYNSPHFSTSFYPEDNSFNALAKMIRASCRTIELFEIAKTVIEKDDRFIVVLTRREGGKEKRPLYISVPDGLPFESEEEVVNHVMANHLERFFETSEVEVEAPTGNFQVINKCGVTGVLLGPPNYHRYTQFVQQHFATQISGMSLEAFRNRIESVRDPEAVSEWTEQMKKVTRYTWKTAEAAPKAKPAVTEKNEAKPAETESAEPKAEEAAVEEETETKAPEAVEVSKPDTAATEESTAVEQPAAQEETPAVEEKPSAPSFDTIEDARLHLLTHARQQVVKTVETVRFHGRLLAGMPDGEIKRAVVGELERQRRFPLDTANGLRGRLRREHFTIFKKGSKGISYVCAVKRKFRVPGQTFADSIGELISFIETHPMIKVSELSSKFAGVETTPKESKEGEPAAEPELTVDQKAKISRMQGDLRWLVMEGYVTEFIDGRLFAAPPIPESKKKAAEDLAHDTESYPDKPAEAKPEPVAAEKSEKPAVGEPATVEAPKVAETTEAPSEQTGEPAKPESTPPVKETENSQKNTESETVQEEATSREKKPESPSSAE